MKKVLTLALVLAAPLFAAVQLRADGFVIHDLTDGTVTVEQLIVTGTSTFSLGNSGSEFISFYITHNGSAITSAPRQLAGLAEPTDITTASDLVQVDTQSANVSLVQFNSDSEGPLFACGGSLCVGVESGQPQSVIAINYVDGTSDTIAIESNPSESSPVPEPSSLLLLASGLLGVGGMVRRKLLA
jgi:hypothetical protein